MASLRHFALGLVAAGLALTACDDPAAPVEVVVPAEEEAIPLTVRPAPFALQQSITRTELGSLGGTFTVATAINNAGDVVGTSSDVAGNRRAFHWRPGRGMVDLGTTGGPEAQALDISDDGTVVGMSRDAAGIPEAFVWGRAEGMRGLGQFGGFESRAAGVNNNGEVVGTYVPAFDPTNPSSFRGVQAFLWSVSAGFRELPTLGSPIIGVARDLNDRGQVAGVSARGKDPAEPILPYVWSRTGGMRDLGPLGAKVSEHQVFGINAEGEVAGGAFDEASQTWRPFIWSPARGYIDLKSLGFPAAASGMAIDINLLGHVTVLVLNADGTRIPAVWIRNAGLVELPTLGGIDGEIWGINDLGRLVGWSQSVAGVMQAAVWKLEFSAEDRIEDVIETIEEIIAQSDDKKLVKELESAVDRAQRALNELAESPADLDKAVGELEKAAKELQQAVGDGLDPLIGASLIDVLVEAARDVAIDAIDAAMARGGDPDDIANAEEHLADGDALRALGDPVGAIDQYQKATQDAQKA